MLNKKTHLLSEFFEMPRRGLEPPRPKGTGPQPAAYAIPPPGLEHLRDIIQASHAMSIPEDGLTTPSP